MAMGGMNMPRVMKKNDMPGGGMISPMEMGMGGKMDYGMGGKMDYGMGGKMDMGHGGDMARAIKIYLMKKGGKTFPDLTGDGKVTFADILKGRKVKLKKKSQAYGGKVMQEGGESDPPRADFLMRSQDPPPPPPPSIESAIAEEARDLSQAASDRESAFGTSSTDVFMNVGDVPTIDSSEDRTKPGSIDPLQRIGPRLIKREVEKGLVGGTREMRETKKQPGPGIIYFNPSTSNIRTFIPTDDKRFDGSRTFGARGFEEEDRIPYGFMEDGKRIFATSAALDKMKEEGVGARGAAAEDYMIELYRSNPDLFTTSPQGGERSKLQIQQRVLDEAKRRYPGLGGFYIPTTPYKMSL